LGASVSGTVIDAATKNPIEGVEVCAWSQTEEEDEDPYCSETDALGQYFMDEIDADFYGVEFWGKPLGYVTQFYDGKLRWWEADEVGIAAEPVKGIDAELVTGGTIEGTVSRAPGGDPVEEATVCAWELELELFGGCTFSDGEGDYALRGLAEGEYLVEFWPGEDPDLLGQYYDGKSYSFEADPVPAGPGETKTGIDAELQVGGTIKGTVRVASTGAPVQWVEVCAWEAFSEGFGGCDYSNADGTYSLERLFPGNYKIEFWTGETETNLLNQYWDHKSLWSEANPLLINGGEIRTGINADLLTPGLPPVKPPAAVITPPPPPVVKPVTSPVKPKKCRKGFKKKRVKGKFRCVKKRKVRRRQQRQRITFDGGGPYGPTRAAYRFGR
ncbi:MAG TPA: carboxypeptidase-like regulatory domain-containing protein, partial [Solirubrobacterales bacterium]